MVHLLYLDVGNLNPSEKATQDPKTHTCVMTIKSIYDGTVSDKLSQVIEHFSCSFQWDFLQFVKYSIVQEEK